MAGVIALFAGTTSFVAARNLFDAKIFGERAEECLSDPAVAAYAGTLVTDAVIKSKPDLIAIRPILEAGARGLVSARPFQALIGAAARQTHDAAMSESTRRVVLSIPDLQILIHNALEQAGPEIAAKVPKNLDTTLASLGDGHEAHYLVDMWRWGIRLGWVWKILFPTGFLLLVGALYFAHDRRHGLVRAGVALILLGVALAALLPLGSLAAIFIKQQLLRGLARGLWFTYFQDLASWGLFFAGVGVLFSAGASSLLEAVHTREHMAKVSHFVLTPPATNGRRFLWSACLLFFGLIAIWDPALVLRSVIFLIGVGAAFVGMREFFRLFLGRLSQREQITSEPSHTHWRLLMTLNAGLLILFGGAWMIWHNRTGENTVAAASSTTACNGYAELCDRRLDEVAFAGTHNSMSNPDADGWMFPQQESSIATQLRDGIRALLIDVHYGFAGGARIKTDLALEPNSEKLKAAIGNAGFDAAMRIRDRLNGVDEKHHGLYFCHGFCELGAYSVVPTFVEIHDFLVGHPDEVLILDIEDYVDPKDLARAFEQSGLAEFVYKAKPGTPWPTLREMISSGQRVAVFLESGKPGVSWMPPAYPAMRETPYSFHKPEEFSCAANRGGDEGSLFLINHWIDSTPTPKPSNAAIVNAYDFLLKRVEQCAEQRHHMANIVAVDFYLTGDLLRVVNAVNKIGGEKSLPTTKSTDNEVGPPEH